VKSDSALRSKSTKATNEESSKNVVILGVFFEKACHYYMIIDFAMQNQ